MAKVKIKINHVMPQKPMRALHLFVDAQFAPKVVPSKKIYSRKKSSPLSDQ